MSAMLSASIQSAMFAEQDRGKHMPFFMPTACMGTTASITIPETDAKTSVSLVARMLSLGLILVLLSILLTLSGLTRLQGLVGLITEIDTGTAQGD